MYSKKNYFYMLAILLSIVFMVSSCDLSNSNSDSKESQSSNYYEKEGGDTPPPHQTQKIAFVYSRESHTFALTDTGALYAWGDNTHGQLGLGDEKEKTTPTLVTVEGVKKWQVIAVGRSHTVALTDTGALYTWGDNTHGQLGLGNKDKKTTPTLVTVEGVKKWQVIAARKENSQLKDETIGVTKWQSIAAGKSYTVAITNTGALYAWGHNVDGQLGLEDDGEDNDRNKPEQVGTETHWKSVAAGSSHTVALTDTGALYTWGKNNSGQLGLGDSGDDKDRNKPEQVGTETHWKSIATGNAHTLALTDTGVLYAWGQNTYGQLGLGNKDKKTTPTLVTVEGVKKWQSIAAGAYHTLVLTDMGVLYAWGRNNNKQLGFENNGEDTNQNTPKQVGDKNHWKSVAGGSSHTVALTDTSALYVWGSNNSGQLGLNDKTNRDNPTAVLMDAFNNK